MFLKLLKWELLAVCIPRLLLIGINFSQPFLINRAVRFLEEPVTPSTKNIGYGLIGATALIYSIKAFLNVQYKQVRAPCQTALHETKMTLQRFTKVMTRFRGSCVCLIFDSTLTMQEGACKDSAAVTLMSTDILSVINNLTNLNEVWASTIEVAIGIYLLARQMSYLAVLPLVIYGISTFFQGKITVRVSL